MSDGRAADAGRCAHTLKGVAGSIGARELQREAGELEAALRRGDPRALVAPLLDGTANQLDRLVAAIAVALPPAAAAAVPLPTIDNQALGDAVRQLDRLISEDAVEAVDVFAAAQPLLAAAYGDRAGEIGRLLERLPVRGGPRGVTRCPGGDMKALAESRVLIVDDAEANVDVLVNLLRADYRLSVALDGETALRAVAKNLPDLVLLDIVMPQLDGYAVCRRLRENEAWREIPVMFLSSLEEATDKARGFEAGGNDYVTKPFEPLEVQARVRSLLRAKAYADAVREAHARDLRIAREIQMGLLQVDLAPVHGRNGTGRRGGH